MDYHVPGMYVAYSGLYTKLARELRQITLAEPFEFKIVYLEKIWKLLKKHNEFQKQYRVLHVATNMMLT